jgi:hypothetical protein
MRTSHIYEAPLSSVPRELGIFMIVVIYGTSDEKEVSRRGRKAVQIMAEALYEEFIQPVSTVDPRIYCRAPYGGCRLLQAS